MPPFWSLEIWSGSYMLGEFVDTWPSEPSSFPPALAVQNWASKQPWRYIKYKSNVLVQHITRVAQSKVTAFTNLSNIFFFYAACSPIAGHGLLILEVFFGITFRHTTVCRTPLDEWSGRHRDLYLKTRSTHNRQTSMPPAGFEPEIPASERPQTYALDRAATGTGNYLILVCIIRSTLQ